MTEPKHIHRANQWARIVWLIDNKSDWEGIPLSESLFSRADRARLNDLKLKMKRADLYHPGTSISQINVFRLITKARGVIAAENFKVRLNDENSN